jgi:hypothetical protein
MGDSKPIVTLAALTVRGGKLASSSEGVSYDSETGVVSFPNPRGLHFVPVISDAAPNDTPHYITTTHYIREIGSTNQFKVWSTALDTTDRNYAPSYFTAVVVGF